MASCSEQQGQTTIPMTEAMQRKVMAENLKGVRHKLFVMSGKGGVGKSSVTVNLAAALAAQGFHVGILDVDLHGPSVPHLLGSHGFVRVDNEDGKLVPVSCGERLSLISIESFLEDKDAAIIWRGPKKVGAIQQFVADVDAALAEGTLEDVLQRYSDSTVRDGELISATFSMESGRTLAIVLRIQNNTYTIEQWKVTAEWIDDGTGENLWLG